MHLSDPSAYHRFEESDDTTFVGVLPVSAVIQSDHSEISITSLAVYSDRMTLSLGLRIRDGHPELEWRDRGRGGHAYTAVGIADDIGTEYIVMPGSGGGGSKEWNQELRIAPGIPAGAINLTISVAETVWEGHMGYRPDGSRELPSYRWTINIPTADLILAKNAEVID